jgi:ribose 1,5-bisphosphokinase
MTSPAHHSGVLVLVVGPSGAGKDSLINAARATLANDPRFVFPRRTVTRPASQWEDHYSVDEPTFMAALDAGAFALSWQAHSLHYGIGAAVNAELDNGKIIICNVSRGIVDEARKRYGRVHVVMIDVQPDVLTARLRARGREPDAASRTGDGRPRIEPAQCETIIDNSGTLDAAAATFIDTLQQLAGTPSDHDVMERRA